MEDQDQFTYQLQLLRDEIGEIHKKISMYDDLSFKIKGWAITLWIGVLGYAINQRSLWISIMMVPVIIAFWFLDAYFKSYQQRSMARMGYIEKFINNSIIGPISNLSDAYEKRSFGSFIIPDPIGRQTCKVDEGFKDYYRNKTSFRRGVWISNVRTLYLFLLISTILAAAILFLLYGGGA